MFCIYLRTNSDLCHLHHKLIGYYNRVEKCLQRGTNWVCKLRCLRFVFKRLIVTPGLLDVYFKHRNWRLMGLKLGKNLLSDIFTDLIKYELLRCGQWTNTWINDTTTSTLAYFVQCFLIANTVLIKKKGTNWETFTENCY
jgi:hypothetical protein